MSEDAQTKSESPQQFELLVAQMNELAQRLQALAPNYTPPPFSPETLMQLLKENLHRFTPEMRLEFLQELRQGLTPPSPQDVLDPDTWKGMWFILNYQAQSQSRSLFDGLRNTVSALPGMGLVRSLPGMNTMSELAEMLEGSSPKDFLDIDTWKGMWYIVNYTIQYEADLMRQRILGKEEEEE